MSEIQLTERAWGRHLWLALVSSGAIIDRGDSCCYSFLEVSSWGPVGEGEEHRRRGREGRRERQGSEGLIRY